MNLLLDTHVFLWWIADAHQLSKRAREYMADGRNLLCRSAASSWEVAIKYAVDRLKPSKPPGKFTPAELVRNRVESLPIVDAHALRAGLLPCAPQRPPSIGCWLRRPRSRAWAS